MLFVNGKAKLANSQILYHLQFSKSLSENVRCMHELPILYLFFLKKKRDCSASNMKPDQTVEPLQPLTDSILALHTAGFWSNLNCMQGFS
jgi:hypothetical protein